MSERCQSCFQGTYFRPWFKMLSSLCHWHQGFRQNDPYPCWPLWGLFKVMAVVSDCLHWDSSGKTPVHHPLGRQDTGWVRAWSQVSSRCSLPLVFCAAVSVQRSGDYCDLVTSGLTKQWMPVTQLLLFVWQWDSSHGFHTVSVGGSTANLCFFILKKMS